MMMKLLSKHKDSMLRETINQFQHGIIYASTIQKGLLPKDRHFEAAFSDHFVYYQPQQIIGGDFYWLTEKNGVYYFALADCTGHGIGGAMLSVLGISLLNYVINKNFDNLGDYLTELDKKWIETFNDENKDIDFNNDWMEITLCSYNPATKEFQYSSANGEFYFCNQKKIELLRGNSYPIGGWQIEKNRSFKTIKREIKEGDRIYLFSDGLKHQYNGMNRKKFSRKRIGEIISNSSHMSLDEQCIFFVEIFNDWKQNTVQTDDVSFIGINF